MWVALIVNNYKKKTENHGPIFMCILIEQFKFLND